ncbi:MAG: YitT family protein [Alistipes sp.]|nr:YitT family protein [Alistipes sp.]
MNTITRKLLIGAKEYLIMTFGMFLYAFGYICCILPAHCMGGGATGVSLLIHYISGGVLPLGVLVLIINGILLIAGGLVVGWNFGIKTLYCIGMLSLMMSILQIPAINEFCNLHLENDRFLSVILGGILAGIGVALSFQQGGSTGGTDIVAMIINKFRTISYGRILITSDFFIIGSALFVNDLGIDGVIYGYVFVAVFGYTVDMIMAGNRQSMQIFIVSRDYRAMADAIINQAHRGATVIDACGWYSKEESKIVMVVCRKSELSIILRIVKTVDPNAFISAGSVMGVYGKGFDALNKA